MWLWISAQARMSSKLGSGIDAKALKRHAQAHLHRAVSAPVSKLPESWIRYGVIEPSERVPVERIEHLQPQGRVGSFGYRELLFNGDVFIQRCRQTNIRNPRSIPRVKLAGSAKAAGLNSFVLPKTKGPGFGRYSGKPATTFARQDGGFPPKDGTRRPLMKLLEHRMEIGVPDS
jgi:hypothetical protein